MVAEMNNKKSLLITIACVLLIILGLFGSLLLSTEIADRIISIITTATAVVGAVALFFQFKRDKNLNEAGFLLEYSQQFYSTYGCKELMNELENCRVKPGYKLDVEKHYKEIVGYLEWLETLSSLVNSGLVQIPKIDNVMSYRYFLIVNNKQIQEAELMVNREFYRSIYCLYPAWVEYKRKNHLPVIFEENDLSKTDGFKETINTRKKSNKT